MATDVWVIAGTPFTDPYPCQCDERRACTQRCPCRGRTDKKGGNE